MRKLILAKTKIGNNSFVEQLGLVPQGYELGDNMLIGVLSKAPTEEQLKNSSERLVRLSSNRASNETKIGSF